MITVILVVAVLAMVTVAARLLLGAGQQSEAGIGCVLSLGALGVLGLAAGLMWVLFVVNH